MYKTQRARLVSKTVFGFRPEQANDVVARAYGFSKYDNTTGQFGAPIPGLHIIPTPVEILKSEPTNQMLTMVRMTLNLTLPGPPNVLNGNDGRDLVATMFGFSNFDALSQYARLNPVNPHSADMAELEKFKARYGFKPMAQVLMGRHYAGGTLILSTDAEETSQFIDKELHSIDLAKLQVAIVRCDKAGDARLNMTMRNHTVIRDVLSENFSSKILGARDPRSNLTVSIVPNKVYTLEQVVASHVSALGKHSGEGRSLIIDGLELSADRDSIDAGIRLAKSHNINVVITQGNPDPYLWSQLSTRLIFGFDVDIIETESVALNTVLTLASPFIGRVDDRLQYVYHSDDEGCNYTAASLALETQKSNVMSRIFGRRLA